MLGEAQCRVRELLRDRSDQIFPERCPELGRLTDAERTAGLRRATHWNDVVTALGYEYLTRHGLRHTGLTWMADSGVKPHVLQKIAGHGSIATTQRYLHPDYETIAEAGGLLSNHLIERSRPNLRSVE